jgi:hypothetical protein
MLRQILESSRFLLVLPVIGSLLLTIGAVIMGLGVILALGRMTRILTSRCRRSDLSECVIAWPLHHRMCRVEYLN